MFPFFQNQVLSNIQYCFKISLFRTVHHSQVKCVHVQCIVSFSQQYLTGYIPPPPIFQVGGGGNGLYNHPPIKLNKKKMKRKINDESQYGFCDEFVMRSETRRKIFGSDISITYKIVQQLLYCFLSPFLKFTLFYLYCLFFHSFYFLIFPKTFSKRAKKLQSCICLTL